METFFTESWRWHWQESERWATLFIYTGRSRDLMRDAARKSCHEWDQCESKEFTRIGTLALGGQGFPMDGIDAMLYKMIDKSVPPYQRGVMVMEMTVDALRAYVEQVKQRNMPQCKQQS